MSSIDYCITFCNDTYAIETTSDRFLAADVVADSRPHTKSAPDRFPGDRRMESPTEERSGSQSHLSDQTSRGSPGDKQQTVGGQSAGGPPPSYRDQPSDQPPRTSQVHGQQHQLGDSFGGRSSAAADSSHMLVQNYNTGFRGGQPAMMPIMTTTHSSSPTLLAPGNSRHGDNGPSSRSKASGQLVSGGSSRRATGTGATLVAISTTTAALMTSFVRCTRRIL